MVAGKARAALLAHPMNASVHEGAKKRHRPLIGKHMPQHALLRLRCELLEVSQLSHTGPVILVRRAADLVDLVELVELGVGPGEEDGPPGEQLGHEAAHGPHVDLGVVVRRAQQQLRCAVPQRHHAVRVAAWKGGRSKTWTGTNNNG